MKPKDMEQSEMPITAEENNRPEKMARPALALEMEDVDKLDTVLRGYYLSQIKRRIIFVFGEEGENENNGISASY